MSDPVLNAQNQPQIDYSQSAGVPESVKRTANQACQPIVAHAPGNTSSPGGNQKLLALAQCMRAHGVPNFPDPDPATGRLTPTGVDTSSAAFQRAAQTCQLTVGGKG